MGALPSTSSGIRKTSPGRQAALSGAGLAGMAKQVQTAGSAHRGAEAGT